MSWSPSIYRFADGGDIPVPPDPAVVRDALGPYAIVEPSDDEYWVRAEDGSEAEFFVGEYGVTVERPQVGGVFDLVAELATRLGAVVVGPGDRVVCRTREEAAHLPESLRDGAIIIEMAGPALQTALTGA
ncbi:hypothetical protein [Streptomyces acidiscabies]|uniref:Uncharacterized protein n=1 Tax=Streptomyces acidiscabies TaxID=42234 RepID=A0A0L0JXK8_9ACTN|nr:hypothetical protein [Streptomyces acidiscabies]KND30253.1 hypothetical protein IQ63_29750 [Streptomyces acidiscabies]